MLYEIFWWKEKFGLKAQNKFELYCSFFTILWNYLHSCMKKWRWIVLIAGIDRLSLMEPKDNKNLRFDFSTDDIDFHTSEEEFEEEEFVEEEEEYEYEDEEEEYESEAEELVSENFSFFLIC